MNKIGFVEEIVFGEKPGNKTSLELMSIQHGQIVTKSKKSLIVNTRFDCPSCGKGIQLQLDTEVSEKRSTELKDKNGVEILEGDVLKLHLPSGEFIHKVTFEDGGFKVGEYPFYVLFSCGEFCLGSYFKEPEVWCEVIK